MHGLKVQLVYPSRQMLGKPGLFLDECLVDQQLGRRAGQLHSSPLINLLFQRTKVPLDPVDTNGQAVLQREVLGMLGQNRGIRTLDDVSKS